MEGLSAVLPRDETNISGLHVVPLWIVSQIVLLETYTR